MAKTQKTFNLESHIWNEIEQYMKKYDINRNRALEMMLIERRTLLNTSRQPLMPMMQEYTEPTINASTEPVNDVSIPPVNDTSIDVEQEVIYEDDIPENENSVLTDNLMDDLFKSMEDSDE